MSEVERQSGRLLIGGEWVASDHLEPDINPSDLDDVIGDYAWASAAQAEDAVGAARHALKAWSRSSPQLRCDILRRTGDLLEASAGSLARLLAREQGKTLKDARGEVLRAAQIFWFFSGEPVRRPGGFPPSIRPGFNIVVDHEPVGVVALITPWNFPLATPAWKIAAALAFANTIVFKPAESTPATAVALTEILIEAGAPAGVMNLILGAGAELGGVLIDGADAISFTGATPTGRLVLERAARTMTKVQLELGGKNPLVVLDDADLDQAVEIALDGGFAQAGQRCTASSRFIVTQGVHDAFVERLSGRVAALRIGHALDETVDIGAIANAAQLAKNIDYVAGATKAGADLLCGGERLTRATPGYFFAPTLFANTTSDMRINREEVFGPIAAVIRVADLDEAIAVANDTEFALSSGICTRSLSAAERFRRQTKSGLVTVNAPTAGVEYHAPFGGRTPSGYGPREQGSAAAEFYTETKTSYINHGVL